MHFRAIADQPSATPRSGLSWLLLGFAVLSLGVHALLFIPDNTDEPLAVAHFGTPYIRVTLSEKASLQGNPKPAGKSAEPISRKPPSPIPRVTQDRAVSSPAPITPKFPRKNSSVTLSASKQPVNITPVMPDHQSRPATEISGAATPEKNHAENSTDKKPDTQNSSRDAQRQKTEAREREAMRNYLLGELRNQLSRYLTYPQRARRRGWEGEVLLALDISTQGKLQNIQLIHSSGYAALDRSAIRSLSRVDKLQLLASVRLQKTINLQLPVIYRLSQN